MPTGALTLGQYPAELVRLACSRCDRAGQYRKARLVAAYGAATPLPDLRTILAQCPRHGALGDACGVYYAELAEAARHS